ncbi:hypothetical protein ACFY8P_04545 [Streptomyces sp. NPDC012693]|uniref:hypothetical protein n=1 Tax=Streptomyces sp. NPDC012693 TaxID=3364844 RepID=UPI003686B69F
MNDQRLDEILDRANAAAPGPWESDGAEIYGTFAGVLSIDLWVGETLNIDDQEQANANASFIAAARTDVPELVAEVAALRARIAELEAVRDTQNRILSDAAKQLGLACERITELETERHTTNEALSDAAEQMHRDRDRIAELETAQGDFAAEVLETTATRIERRARRLGGEWIRADQVATVLRGIATARDFSDPALPQQLDRRAM